MWRGANEGADNEGVSFPPIKHLTLVLSTELNPGPHHPPASRPIALIGLPGSGKSSLGRRLAQRLDLPFLDADTLIEQRIGCSIREFFDREGEARFRDIEAEAIADLAHGAASVISTGGGSVLREANRLALHGRCHVVYLQATPEDLMRRLRHDVKRPLLQVADPLGRLRELHAARDPLYREAAHDVVPAGRSTVSAVVEDILARIESAGCIVRPPAPR